MNYFARRIAAHLSEKEVIRYEQQAYYAYGLEIILSNLILFASVLVIAALLNQILASILFTAAFAVLRFSFGGFHCKSYSHCYMVSMLIYFVFVTAYIFNSTFEYGTYISLMVLISAGIGFLFLNLPMPFNRRGKPSNKSHYMLFGSYFTVVVILLATPLNKMAFPITYAMLVTVLLLFAQKLTGGKKHARNQKVPAHEDCC